MVARPRDRGRRLHRLAPHARAARRRAAGHRARQPLGRPPRRGARRRAIRPRRHPRRGARWPKRCAGVDCVFHLAAQVTIRGSFDRFHEDLDTNVMGTARLLRAVDRGTREVVHAGVVDGRVRRCATPPRRSTNRIPRGRCRRTASASSPPRTCRSQILDGAWHSLHRGPLLQHLRSGPDLHALCRRPDDLHHAIAARRIDHDFRRRRAAARLHSRQRHRRRARWRRRGRRPGRYNLGTGRGTSLNQLAAMVTRTGSIPALPPQHAPAPPGELRYSIADISAARTALSVPRRRIRSRTTWMRSSRTSAGASGRSKDRPLRTANPKRIDRPRYDCACRSGA